MNNNVYILEDRAILYINGLDAKDFLQNLISNDINKVSDSSSCFASLLTPQGKFLYEFIVVKHKSGYFIDCEKSQSEEIFKQLNLYKIRSKVEILNLSNEFVVASFGYDKYLSLEGSKDILGFQPKLLITLLSRIFLIVPSGYSLLKIRLSFLLFILQIIFANSLIVNSLSLPTLITGFRFIIFSNFLFLDIFFSKIK